MLPAMRRCGAPCRGWLRRRWPRCSGHWGCGGALPRSTACLSLSSPSFCPLSPAPPVTL
uniref:Alternative protein GPR144 n=1 Tax=Homo sapiens TaxID=9606 RepID=L8E9C3_HUMAN|nr:alternative protein GPR144 [Homo sapiens]